MPLDANIERILARIIWFKDPNTKIKKELKIKIKFFISKNSIY